jgi:hypothetical protein
MQSKLPRTVRRVTTAIATACVVVGCGGAHHGEPGLGMLNDARFRSYVLLPIPAANGADCTTTRLVSATGKRPLCANTLWVGGTCKITGLRAGCACYEGQAHACDKSTSNACTGGAPSCGVKACLVDNDSLSSWSACSLL